MTMKHHSLRRPRRGIPNDLVSCPPALNLKKMDHKRTRRFVNELVKISPHLEVRDSKSRNQETKMELIETDLAETTPLAPELPYHEPVALPSIEEILASPPEPPVEEMVDNKRQYKTSKKCHAPSSRPPHHPPPPEHCETTSDLPKSPHNHRSRRRRSSPSIASDYGDAVSYYSMFSIYSTATAIARRPAWGHYVVGVLVFIGWTLHHWYYAEYFRPHELRDSGRPLLRTVDVIRDVSSDAKPSMLRGAVRGAAIARMVDYEKRNDYEPVKQANAAFSSLQEDPVREKEIKSASALEEEIKSDSNHKKISK